MENRKRPLTPTESSAGKRPRVVGTKASQARAKAITAQLDSTKPKVPQRKRPAVLAETDPLAKSYHTKASGLKQRPSWDLRVIYYILDIHVYIKSNNLKTFFVIGQSRRHDSITQI